MSVLKAARQKAGYDSEELWFHLRDRELIAKMKKPRLRLIQGGADSQNEKSASTVEEDEDEYSKAA